MADCFKKLRKELPEDVTDDVIKKVLAEVEKLKEEPDFRKAATDLRKSQQAVGARALKERSQNLAKTKERFALYDQFKDKTKGLLAAFEGATGIKTKGRLSVFRRQQAIAQDLRSAFYYGLKDEGVYDLIKDGKIDREIAQELFELRPGGKSGISGSDEALRAAKVFRKLQDKTRFTLKKAGIDIGHIPGYIASQTHNRELINPNVADHKADFSKWLDDILPGLDELTFKDVKNRKKFMNDIFDDIRKDRHQLVEDEGVSDMVITAKGFSPNMSKKLGASRVLHFKSGDAWFKYNQKYGTKDLMQSVEATIDKTARTAGLVEIFGTNPRGAVEADIRRLDIPVTKRNKIEEAMLEAEGATQIAGRSFGARSTATLRIVASTSKLGTSALAGMVDTATSGAAIRTATGMNFFEAIGSGGKGFGEHLVPSERKKLFRHIRYGAEDLGHGMYHRFSLDENQPGAMARGQELFFKINGAQYQASTARAAVAGVIAREAGEVASKLAWDDLNFHWQSSLEQFGITKQDWSIVRQGTEKVGESTMLTPEAIERLPDTLFKNKEQKVELALRWQVYLADFAEMGSPQPGAKERRLLLKGTSADSGFGMALRLLTQFKSFPVAMHSVISRSLLATPKRLESLTDIRRPGDLDGQNLAGVIVFGMGIAYLAMSAKALAAGQTPPDPADPKTWAEAFVRSGSAGLYGDFLFGEYDQMYRSVLKDAAGPVLGQLDDVGEIYASAFRGDIKGNKIVRLLKNNLPGQNLFYTKAAMDYLIWWRINEALNPGYIRRMKKRVRSEGREFLVEPGG